MVNQRGKEQVFMSLVVYCDKFDDNIKAKLVNYYNILNENFTEIEFIIVNDSEINITDQLESDMKSTVINMSAKTGLELSLKAGIDFCIGDVVLIINSLDYNLDLGIITRCYNELANGFDIISLSPSDIKISSKAFYKLMHISGLKHELYTEIATIITRRAINVLNKFKHSTFYRKAMYGSLGYKHKWLFCEITSFNTEEIPTKINNAFNYILTYSTFGTKISIFISLLCLTISILLGGYSLGMKLFYDQIFSGWASIMVFMSFGFSGIFAILTIMCKYFEILVNNTLLRSQYKISSIDNHS